MYLKIAWHLKTYIDTNSSIDFEKLHQIKNQWLFGVNKALVFLKKIKFQLAHIFSKLRKKKVVADAR